MMYSYHLLAVKINYMKSILENTDDITMFERTAGSSKRTVYQYRDKSTHQRHVHRSTTSTGHELERTFLLRQAAKAKLAKYQSIWNSTFVTPCPVLDLRKIRRKRKPFITKELFDSLIPCSNTKKIIRPNPYNGIVFRSKSEREIAEFLDSIDVSYKYEPLLQFDGTDVHPDFVCFLPELGAGFIIEHCGLIDKGDYIEKTIFSFRLYTSHGLLPGYDFLFTYETEAFPPTSDYFVSQITKILDAICSP